MNIFSMGNCVILLLVLIVGSNEATPSKKNKAPYTPDTPITPDTPVCVDSDRMRKCFGSATLDDCENYPVSVDPANGKDMLNSPAISVAPMGFKSVKIKEPRYLVSLMKYFFFIDSGSPRTCFNDTLVAELAREIREFSRMSPFYPWIWDHGGSWDLGFAVNMYFKFGNLPIFAHEVVLGCPSGVTYAWGVIGKDLMLNLQSHYLPGKSLTVFKPPLDHFLQSHQLQVDKKEYLRPDESRANIYKLLPIVSASLDREEMKEFWNFKQNYTRALTLGRLGNNFKRAFLIVGSLLDFDISSEPLPARLRFGRKQHPSTKRFADAVYELTQAKLTKPVSKSTLLFDVAEFGSLEPNYDALVEKLYFSFLIEGGNDEYDSEESEDDLEVPFDFFPGVHVEDSSYKDEEEE